jgi:hypothetical protein
MQPDYPVTFVVERRHGKLTVGGQSACNYYGAELAVERASLELRNLHGTGIDCAAPVMALEAAYLKALGKATEFQQTEDRLTLTGPGAELRFEPLPSVPTAQLVDTVWELETFSDGGVATTATGSPTLELRSDGTFDVTTGSDVALRGTWIESRGAVMITGSRSLGAAPMNPQIRAIMNATGNFYVEIDGNQLTVTGLHGTELVYRRSP